MRRSDRAVGVFPPSVPSLPSLCAEAGKLQPAPLLGVPNLPNVRSLALHACSPVRVRGRGGTYTPPRALACAPNKKVGKVGKVGNKQGLQGFWLPNLGIEAGKAGKQGREA